MSNKTHVIYNASCPVCSAEIDHYRAYSTKRALPISYADIGDADLTKWGLSRDDAAKRLHVVQDGELLSGVPAFAALWAEMPRYRWVSRLVMVPGIRHVAAAIYNHILAPALYARHRRREALANAETQR